MVEEKTFGKFTTKMVYGIRIIEGEIKLWWKLIGKVSSPLKTRIYIFIWFSSIKW